MATGTINKQLSVETAQATITQSFTNVRTNQAVKIGNLVYYQFNATANQSIAAWTEFLKMPFDLEQGAEVQFHGVYNDADDILAMFEGNGATFISSKTAMTSGKKISFNVVYLTVD